MPNNTKDYKEFVKSRISPHIRHQPHHIMMNAAMGLCGESGEIIDLVKKHVYHGHALDMEEFYKELGDVVFYAYMLCEALGINMEDIQQRNIHKLTARYPEGFTVERSINRDA